MNNQDEINRLNKERDEVLKRIEENKRLMEFIQNKNIKGGLNDLELFKKNRAARKIQNAFRKHVKHLENEKEKKKLKEISKYENKMKEKNLNLDLIFSIKKIQKKFRSYILKKHREDIREYYISQIRKDFHKPISHNRIIETRNQLIKKLETMDYPSPDDYEKIVNFYFENYKAFNFEFPLNEELRLDNFFIYYQNLELVKYMESLKGNDDIIQFNKFKLDKNKMPLIRNIVNKMENDYNNKNDFYSNYEIDDFEENAILDEIDERYHFEKRSDILNKK
jgi:hypothetical protein